MEALTLIFRSAAVVLMVMTLSGCTTHEQILQEQAAAQSDDEAKCRDKGYVPPSKEFDQCMSYLYDQYYRRRERVSQGLRGEVSR
jgi:hypothetical protein